MTTENQTIGFTPLASVVSQQQLIEATSIVAYHSQGNVLVIGSSEDALAAVSQLSGLKATVVTIDPQCTSIEKKLTEDGVSLYQTSSLQLVGYLGHYHAVAIGDADQLDLGVGVYLETGLFDLVLDLSAEPHLASELAPFGYLHAPDAATLAEALAQLPDLIGDFEKPKYFNYRADVCAHSRSELNGCTNCIDVCAANAITTRGEGISVDAHLCQGCGSCATVCPSGAMSYAYPRASDAIGRSRKLMAELENCSVVLLHCEDHQQQVDDAILPINVLALAVEEVTAFGMDYWAALLASGIQRIYLVFGSEKKRSDRDAVLEQAEWFHQLMAGLGVSNEIVIAISEVDLTTLATRVLPENALVGMQAATFDTHDDKRQTLRMAIDHLYEQLGCVQDVQPLPANAAHGLISIDESSCTLCMACVSVCPSKALLDGQESPAVRIIEANCLQCGLCDAACPESAITLKSQYRYDSIDARKILTLNEEEPFHCVTCHKAFASQGMIRNMLGKLTSHWMYQDEKALRRLKMCDDCRVKDIFNDDGDVGIEIHRDSKVEET
ncbi:MAG: 4Fe-4S dicluster domain-containing protein [Granulosicoccaceae bacterium]